MPAASIYQSSQPQEDKVVAPISSAMPGTEAKRRSNRRVSLRRWAI